MATGGYNCCLTLAGIPNNCSTNVGGIARAWATCYSEAGTPTVGVDEVITALGATDVWHEYHFNEETSQFATAPQIDDANGSLFFQTTLNLLFAKQDAAKRLEVQNMALSGLAFIIEDNNGVFYYLGYNRAVRMTSDSSIETGTALADFNGYNLTFIDRQNQIPYTISEEAMQPILNPTEE